MYKRPNAPFKAPRRLSPSNQSKESAQLFVSEPGSNSTPKSDSDVTSSQPTRGYSQGLSRKATFKRPRLNNSLAQTPSAVPAPTTDSSEQDPTDSDSTAKYYTVQWRKRSNKKNKSWDGDGYVCVTDHGISFKIQQSDYSYKSAGRSKKTVTDGVFVIGTYEVEVDSPVTKAELFGKGQVEDSEHQSSGVIPPPATPFVMPKPKAQVEQNQESEAQFDYPASIVQDPKVFNLHSSNIPNAREVTIDPNLAAVLRPHQVEGINFLYECLMGFRNKEFQGAILADEMGLGKTLMTITLIWTLLKQSPYPEEKGHVKKVLICCPLTLIGNWEREFSKWLNMNRIGVLTINGKNQSAAKDKVDILNFGKMNVYQVLIMSYEKVITTRQELSKVDVDLLVCDEGHRLKSASAKVLKILDTLPTKKRLLLSGTPIQNDLLEFHTIINFINPGILGNAQEFQKEFLRPILRSRDPACVDAHALEEGKRLSSALIETTKQFILRRTKSVIEEFLTKKTDVLLFCPPTALQKKLFNAILSCSSFNSILDSNSRDVLSMITVFRKVCNSPSLLATDNYFQSIQKTFGNQFKDLDPASLSKNTTGSKVNVLIPLLCEFRQAGERVVIVSNYTQTLDLLEQVLLKLNYSFLRLDGATQQKSRVQLVNTFNTKQNHNAFLLSAKAGGVGLNLIGASRLVLFDNDWNPSVDLQAMARIHRDGQKKPVFIYRLFTTGSIDEKIFQRQLMKNNLSDMFLDDDTQSDSNIFDYHDLRNIFTVMDTICNTHDLIECGCHGDGKDIDFSSQPLTSSQSSQTDREEDSDSENEGSQTRFSSSPGWMSALQYKALDKSSVVKKEAIRSALSRYRHFDPKRFSKRSDTGDKVLNNLLSKAENGLSYAFTYSES